MKPSVLAVATALLLTLAAPASASTTWQADPNHSSAQFTAVHLLISHVSGIIPIKSATVVTDSNGVPQSVKAELDPRGIDTRVGMRDDDLRSAHFFDVGTYPAMTFESTKVAAKDATHFVIDGNLTMHGQTNPVVLTGQVIGKGPGMRPGEQRIAFTADGTIDRSQWGMTYGNVVASYKIDIHLEIEAVKQ